MDFKTLMESLNGMNDEELRLIEKKAHDESRRRAVNIAGGFAVGAGSTEVLIDFVHLTNAVRENLRADMSLCSETALASVLDQTKNYSEEAGNEVVVIELLRTALTAALIHEARCETARRMDSIR